MAKVKKNMGVQQVLLKLDQETESVIRYLCEQSGKLYNTGVYFARQTYFKTGKLMSGKFDLIYEPSIGKTTLAASLPSIPAQQTLMSVSEGFKGYKELINLFRKGKLTHRPKLPGYLKGSKLFKVAYVNSGTGKLKLTDKGLRFPLGNTVSRWFSLKEFYLPMSTNIDLKDVKEFTILPKNGSFYLEISYLLESKINDLDPSQALGIDLGVADNLASCVDTLGNSFLIDSRVMKSMNRLYNKKISTRKENKPQGYWDEWLDRVTRKRNHQMKDGINKAAKYIINHCIEQKIGTLVVGWNVNSKSNANMGRLNNQKFVQMPIGKLKTRLSQLCQLNGIEYIETEEAYTSKASFLDGDSLPKFGFKPDGWKASGNRIKRGLYKTFDGSIINADLNGAANILRKVSTNLGIDLSKVSRRCLTTVSRVRLWDMALARSLSTAL